MKSGSTARIEPPGGKYKYMNLNLSTSDWLNAALGVLFLYRGIRDLYNGTGTGWSNEDEKNHFHRPTAGGVARRSEVQDDNVRIYSLYED